MAINYKKLIKTAISGYSENLESGLILPEGPEAQYFDAKEVTKYGASSYNPEGAKALLKEIGYTPQYKGKTLVGAQWVGKSQFPIKLTCPNGWTDFMMIVENVIQDLRAVGIYAEADYIDAAKYWTTMHTGEFDLFLDTPFARLDCTSPYTRFKAVMSSVNWKPVGKKMYENKGRFNKPGSANFIPAVDSLLALAAVVDYPEKLKNIYGQLNRIYMEQQPTIPLCYRPEEFYQFSEKHWTGFPQFRKSSIPPLSPVSGAARKMLWRIEPVNK